MVSDRKGARWLRVVTLALSGVLALAVLEIGMRVYYRIHNAREQPHSILDDDRGWKSTPNMRRSYTVRNFGTVHYSTDADGFRGRGDLRSDGTRVLVLGDSFTQATQISDGATYFDYLQRQRPDLQIFAYGVGGYGTLQELMALEQFKKRIEPDLVLWQFCINDFIANDHELESKSVQNNHLRRPFLEHGRVVRRHPDNYVAFLSERSYLVRRLSILYESVTKRTVGKIDSELSFDHPVYRRSLETTRILMRRAVEVAGDVPLVVFNVAPLNSNEFETTAFNELCEIEGVHCVPDLRPAFLAAQRAGQQIDGGPGDAHWNESGHAIAGRAILRYLQEQGFVDSPPGL